MHIGPIIVEFETVEVWPLGVFICLRCLDRISVIALTEEDLDKLDEDGAI